MSDAGEPPVVDDVARHRLVVGLGADTAELVYRVVRGRLLILHTEVPERLRGGGVGGRLVAAALDRAVADDLTIVPLCPYARSWLERHPDAAKQVVIDWSGET